MRRKRKVNLVRQLVAYNNGCFWLLLFQSYVPFKVFYANFAYTFYSVTVQDSFMKFLSNMY